MKMKMTHLNRQRYFTPSFRDFLQFLNVKVLAHPAHSKIDKVFDLRFLLSGAL